MIEKSSIILRFNSYQLPLSFNLIRKYITSITFFIPFKDILMIDNLYN